MKQTKIKLLSGEDAVSPVVGVMLMLVVTIIIAAVVSGFTGGLASTTEKAPTIAMDVSIKNGGHWSSSHFSALVTGVEKGISTSDLKLVTKWSKVVDGDVVNGGATVVPGQNNTHLHFRLWGYGSPEWFHYPAPMGFGPGVDPEGRTTYTFQPHQDGNTAAQYGSYNLVTGTAMYAEPFGGCNDPNQGGFRSFNVGYGVITPFEYTYGDGNPGWGQTAARFYPADHETYPSIDQMTAILGDAWHLLRSGDTVEVSLVHIPSGKVIWQKDIVVEG